MSKIDGKHQNDHGDDEEFHISKKPKITETKNQLYSRLLQDVKSVLIKERDFIANTANVSSLLYHSINEVFGNLINWCGFYFLRSKEELVLGPFQGKIACIRINIKRGVCGHTVRNQLTTVVEDVHKFPGHIACDSASQSEIVIPIFSEKEKKIVGVLDIDSPVLGGITNEDKDGLEPIVKIVAECCDWSEILKQQQSGITI